MRIVTFKIEEDFLEKLDSLAKLKGITRSEAIRRAIRLYLQLEEKKLWGKKEPKRVILTS